MAKSTKPRQPAPVEESPPAPVGRRRWWLRPGTIISFLFVIAAIGLASVLHRVLPDLTGRPEYQFRMEETRITPPNEWVPKGILSEVLAGADLPETVSLLDPELCRKVAEAWDRHPWVKRVNSVRITSEPALVVDLEYRAPAAFIEVPQGFYPVDVDGVLLPPRDFSMAATSRLPHVRNITSTPTAGAGHPWEDVVVSSAAKLAAVLAPQQDLKPYWEKFQLKSIVAPVLRETPHTADQLTFELETAGGNRVVWGKAPGSDTLEPTPEVKLARLAEYQSRFGSLDGVNGLHRIDIRLFDGISLQPLDDFMYR
ncbi:cell division protein FtsQ/DivIB [Planctomicrobium sp. SH661]|uniref:cell division protein FtsQ/DivIB n=1 Tax=Planctomicrobium sp. SH661 TaxID=3448124 RepID=UPI003F5B5D29